MAITGNINYSKTQAVNFINQWASDNNVGISAKAANRYDGIVIFDSDNNIIVSSNYTSSWIGFIAYYNNGASYVGNYAYIDASSSGHDVVYDIYSCSNGLLIKLHDIGSNADTTKFQWALITKTNNDKIAIVVNSNDASYNNPVCCIYDQSSEQNCTYTSNSANSTSLSNFVSKGSIGVDSSCQYAFFMPLYQYNSTGILTLDGIDYITNGYWCIQD
jgi:hypothetical protein